MFHRILVTLMMLGFVVIIAGCNTFAGAGKDIQRGGEVIEDTAEETKRKM